MPLYKEEEELDIYKTVDDVPASYKPTIEKLIKMNALKGFGDTDNDGKNEINVDETYCRVMTTLDRLGVLD